MGSGIDTEGGTGHHCDVLRRQLCGPITSDSQPIGRCCPSPDDCNTAQAGQTEICRTLHPERIWSSGQQIIELPRPLRLTSHDDADAEPVGSRLHLVSCHEPESGSKTRIRGAKSFKCLLLAHAIEPADPRLGALTAQVGEEDACLAMRNGTQRDTASPRSPSAMET